MKGYAAPLGLVPPWRWGATNISLRWSLATYVQEAEFEGTLQLRREWGGATHASGPGVFGVCETGTLPQGSVMMSREGEFADLGF
jgi:hypothetical protein